MKKTKDNQCDSHYKVGGAFSTFKFIGHNLLLAVCGDFMHQADITLFIFIFIYLHRLTFPLYIF
jgi:hypothetical protein